jgi:hypothetical protein
VAAVSTLSAKPSPFRSVYEIDGCDAVWPALMPTETENVMAMNVKLNAYLMLPEAVLDAPSATAGLPGWRATPFIGLLANDHKVDCCGEQVCQEHCPTP